MKNLKELVLKNGKNLILCTFYLILILTILLASNSSYKRDEVDKIADKEVKTYTPLTEPLPGYTPITSASDLANINTNSTTRSGKYILMNDIDMSGVSYTPIGKTSSSGFKGVFDGNGYTIKNLSINSSSTYVGMFGYISGAEIRNLTLENINITSSSSASGVYIGGIVGCGTKENVIENVHITGNSVIKYTNSKVAYMGGLLGNFYGEIKNSSAKAKIDSKSGRYIGGLIGKIQDGVVSNCYADTNISIDTESYCFTGGLIGHIINNEKYKTELSSSYAKGNILINGKASSSNSSKGRIGGLIGSSVGITDGTTSSKKGSTEDVYSTVNIKMTSSAFDGYVGSLIGYNNCNKVNRAYAIGKVDMNDTNSKAIVDALMGYNSSDVTNLYWSYETTGIYTSQISTAKGEMIQPMLNKEHYSSFNFSSVWAIKENGGSLPYLRSLGESDEILEENIDYLKYSGTGTKEDPIRIGTVEQLGKINVFNSRKYMILENSIDGSGITDFKAIGDNGRAFDGILDGNNNTISNLTVTADLNCVGLFATNTGTIKNLELSNITVVNSKNTGRTNHFVGALVALNTGILENIEIKDDVSINNEANVTNLFIGQVAGCNNRIIMNSQARGVTTNTGNVTNLNMGQVAGENFDMIVKCSNTGTINNTGTVTNGRVGGIVGYNRGYGLIKLCDNKGSIEISEIDTLNEGGIAGNSAKDIFDSYSKGTAVISAETAYIGGIVGYNTGNVVNTYSLDSIQKTVTNNTWEGIAGYSGTVTSSYFNIDGIEEVSGRGSLKTLAELQQQATFEDWNFDNVWSMGDDVTLRTVGATNTPVFNSNLENYFYNDSIWEWHSRLTESDTAYNGEHIRIDSDKIGFFGYSTGSYKDFLYRYNAEDVGIKKTFTFTLDETKANYSTVDGAGLLFDTNIVNDKLSGYVLLVRKDKICIYRLDNVDVNTFEMTPSKTIEQYAGTPIASCEKAPISSSIHNFVVKTSPTNVTVIDNEQPIFDVNLDESKYVGGDYGLITSYSNTNTGTLSEVYFRFNGVQIECKVPVYKVDEKNNPLPGVKFQVKNEAEEIVQEGLTDEEGMFYIQGLPMGTYTLQEVETASEDYALVTKIYKFNLSTDGKAYDINTKKQITDFRIKNVPISFYFHVYGSGGNGIPGRNFYLYDSSGNVIRDSNGNPRVFTSDSSGRVNFSGGIKPGTYTYKPAGGGSGSRRQLCTKW